MRRTNPVPLLYYDPRLSTPQVIPGVNSLPSENLKNELDTTSRQQLIPFLGAGASMQGNIAAAQPSSQDTLPEVDLENLSMALGLQDKVSKNFLSIALKIAQLIDLNQTQARRNGPRVIDSTRAPSSWRLASIFAEMLEIEPFQPHAAKLHAVAGRSSASVSDALDVVTAVAELLNLHHSIPQLLTMASYFAQNRRRDLRLALSNLFAQVTQVTTIQKQLVQKAKAYTNVRNLPGNKLDKNDYIIITTNYDRLIEQELERNDVPYCVITVSFDSKVYLSFSPLLQAHFGLDIPAFTALKNEYVGLTSKDFRNIRKSRSLVMLYKMHGCPYLDIQYNINNIVIGDSDYIRFIQSNGRGNTLIPSYIGKCILQSRLLFLGYSFSDWNVRSIYEHFAQSRMVNNQSVAKLVGPTDYVILRSYSVTDDLFFRRWSDDLSILVTDLSLLADDISAA
jgi:SIR2-like domain